MVPPPLNKSLHTPFIVFPVYAHTCTCMLACIMAALETKGTTR